MAPITVSRLVNAQVLRQELSQQKDADRVLIVSATVYDEVVRSRFGELDPDMFCHTNIRARGARLIGYVYQGSWSQHLETPLDATGNTAFALSALPAQASSSRQHRSRSALTQTDLTIPAIQSSF